MTRSKTIRSPRIATILLVAGTALAVAATPALAAAQDPGQVDAVWEPAAVDGAILGLGADDGIVTSAFGTQDVDIATISWMRFFPVRSSDGYGFGGSGTIARHAIGSDTRLFAEVTSGEVPNGALITQIVFYVRDNHGDDITGNWCVFDVESNLGSGYDGGCSPVGGTSGTPGQTLFFSEPATTVQRRFHNGTEFRIGSYGLLFWPGTATDQLDIRLARILWRRQVSPAPASATFDDVPTSNLFFRSIEALADSGITGGCGDGSNYCPNSPVTRGQMAAFLASALGLHWPAF